MAFGANTQKHVAQAVVPLVAFAGFMADGPHQMAQIAGNHKEFSAFHQRLEQTSQISLAEHGAKHGIRFQADAAGYNAAAAATGNDQM